MISSTPLEAIRPPPIERPSPAGLLAPPSLPLAGAPKPSFPSVWPEKDGVEALLYASQPPSLPSELGRWPAASAAVDELTVLVVVNPLVVLVAAGALRPFVCDGPLL
jgi:hypothetical protein